MHPTSFIHLIFTYQTNLSRHITPMSPENRENTCIALIARIHSQRTGLRAKALLRQSVRPRNQSVNPIAFPALEQRHDRVGNVSVTTNHREARRPKTL